MLVAGGLLDQPAGEWLAQNYAGAVWDMLERSQQKSFSLADLKPSEAALNKQITEMITKIAEGR